MTDLAPPVRYTPDVETVAPDEGDTIATLNDTFDTILDTPPRMTAMPCARCTPRRMRFSKRR